MRCYPLARSSSLHLPHPPTWNLDSPLPSSTHPSPPRLQEKVENCDYKDFPARPLSPRRAATPVPNPLVSPASCRPTYRSSLLLSSFRLLLPAPDSPTASLLLLSFFFTLVPFHPFCSFLYFSFLPTLRRFFSPVGSLALRSRARCTPSRIKTLTLCYPFSRRSRMGVGRKRQREKEDQGTRCERSRRERGKERKKEREGGRLATVIQGFRYVGQISVSGANFAFDKMAHFTFRTSTSFRAEIASCDNEQVSRNIRAER